MNLCFASLEGLASYFNNTFLQLVQKACFYIKQLNIIYEIDNFNYGSKLDCLCSSTYSLLSLILATADTL